MADFFIAVFAKIGARLIESLALHIAQKIFVATFRSTPATES